MHLFNDNEIATDIFDQSYYFVFSRYHEVSGLMVISLFSTHLVIGCSIENLSG